jgi:hypothetical protein
MTFVDENGVRDNHGLLVIFIIIVILMELSRIVKE